MMNYSEITHVNLAQFTKQTLLVFLLFMCRVGYTQQPVKQIAGVVIDARSKSPLSGANVYIQQTTIASTTKEDGTFVLNVPSGNYNLIVSYVGYKPFLHALNKSSINKIYVDLEADTKLLNEVNITVDLNWQNHFSLFQKLFLGKNAKQCTILNPKVLFFNYNKDGEVLTAEASEPLVIDNYVLGYTLYYDLGSFIHYEGRTSYSGFTRYQEMTPKVKKDRRTWKANRSRAYLGSSFHFMHSLVNDRLRKAGFVVKKLVKSEHPPRLYTYLGRWPDKELTSADTIVTMSWKKTDEISDVTTSLPVDSIKTKRKIEYNILYPGEVQQSQIVRASETDNSLRMAFDHSLFVAYTKRHSSVEISLLTMLESEASVDQYGNLNNPNSVLFEGYWATLGVGDELPINYRLQNDK